MKLKKISAISAQDFENLTFDILQLSGMKSIIWRTPGADGGRDIECTFPSLDFSGQYLDQKWYVECKKYSSSIDWPTLWKKIAYADSKGADYLLLVTSNNPSPQCESEIVNWNKIRGRVIVRVWRGYELERIILNYPAIAAKYGLIEHNISSSSGLNILAFEGMKVAQTSFVAYSFGQNITYMLEANAALAELISARSHELELNGKILFQKNKTTSLIFDWLDLVGEIENYDEVGLRAFLCMLRYLTSSETIRVETNHGNAIITLNKPKLKISESAQKILNLIGIWGGIEVQVYSEYSVTISNQ